MPFEFPKDISPKPNDPEKISARKNVEDISVENLTGILKNELPELEIKNARLIESGADNAILEINDEYMFRFPRKGQPSVQMFDVENRFLRAVRGKTTAEIPAIAFEGKEFQYIGYKKIKGALLQEAFPKLSAAEKEIVASDTAKFLYELSTAISASDASAIGIKEKPIVDKNEIPDLRERVTANISDKGLQDFLLRALDRYEHFLAEPPEHQVLLHGDIKPANLIINSETKRLCGVIDWSDMSVGDIYDEFPNMMIRDIKFGKQVAVEYGKLSGVSLSEEKLEIHTVVRKIRDLRIASRIPKAKERLRDFMKAAIFK